jgi:hypothetical protein
MHKPVKKISRSGNSINPYTDVQVNRYEHWLISNQVYFITARCRDKFPAFKTEKAKAIFWDRFEHYTQEVGFEPWIASLMDIHYHFEGILRVGENLPKLMQRLHGSVAKLVNDTLDVRLKSFWRNAKGKECFDECLRDEKQGRLTWRYVYRQAVRHRICADPREYPHTRVYVELDDAIAQAKQLNAFLNGVPYKRYQK